MKTNRHSFSAWKDSCFIIEQKINIISIMTERLDIKTQISEAMIMGLRMTEGVDLNKMQQRFGIDVLKFYGKEIQTLLDKKMAVCEAGMLCLTPYGMQYGNQACEAFV